MAQDKGVPASPSGSQASPGAAKASPPSVSIPNASDDPDPYWDYDDDDECWNCGGEGFVYGCSWDWQCDTWDGDSCLCTRPCHICNPPKPNPELQAVLAEALRDSDRSGEAGETRSGSTEGESAGRSDSEGIAQ